MIFYDFKYNLTTQQSLIRLRIAFGDIAPCKTTIYNWFAEFKRGLVYLSDEFRDGRPSTALNNKNIDVVRRMIETDRHVSYHEIWTSLGIDISYSTQEAGKAPMTPPRSRYPWVAMITCSLVAYVYASKAL
ncbi:hypothetical protein EVAR_21240_1 [Eumeta japonica]|uniref:Mos1 transposase HTH domain-containing protein n=1 Tax=Eumeta variegata TaxID=151549 RepID=A0A4C1Z251_EUMVA|nr:hypothetical protein EVAR_21240_1 [Eumeta japonica]